MRLSVNTGKWHRKNVSVLLLLLLTTITLLPSSMSAFFLPRRQQEESTKLLLFKLRNGSVLPSSSSPSSPIDGRIHQRSEDVTSKRSTSRPLSATQDGPNEDLVPSISGISSLTKSSSTTSSTSSSSSQEGLWILCFVAFLYGTLNVSLRAVYGGVPNPPSAATLSAVRGWLATLGFVLVSSARSILPTSSTPSTRQKVTSPLPEDVDVSSNIKSMLLAGFELAIWNGLAQGLLNAGLLSTGSARASFLTQTSVVWTPVLFTLFVGRNSVRPTTWIGCSIALFGLTLLSSGGGTTGDVATTIFSVGDFLVLGGALAWSAYLIRLGRIGDRYPEIPLQFVKTFLLGILYTVWFAVTLLNGNGTLISNFSTSMAWAVGPGALAAWCALFYSAVGPGAVADVMQQQGQRTVPASQANVLLSLEPVFAAICSRLLLGEVTTMKENIGGSLIVLAALVATLAGSSKTENVSSQQQTRIEFDGTTPTLQ